MDLRENTPSFMKTLAERLEYALILREITQSELARRAGVSRGTISNVMKGVAKNFNAEISLKVAKALEVDPYWLILGEGKPIKETIQMGLPEEAKSIVDNLPESAQILAINLIKQLKNSN